MSQYSSVEPSGNQSLLHHLISVRLAAEFEEREAINVAAEKRVFIASLDLEIERLQTILGFK